jgi:dTDP-4-dehydrorhamnose reductase
VELVLVGAPNIHGVYHVAGPPISKYELLTRIRDRLGLPVTIERDVTFECDRSLDAGRFHEQTGYSPPTWEVMINDMVSHLTERDV